MNGYFIGEFALADNALNAVLIRYPVFGSGRVLEPLQRVVDRRDNRADRALQLNLPVSLFGTVRVGRLLQKNRLVI